MTKDLINTEEIYFPTYSGSNAHLITLLNKTSKIICDWFSDAEKYGPLPMDENLRLFMPEEEAINPDDLFHEIDYLLSNSFNPVHPGSLAHLDPPPLSISILGDLIAASLNNNLLAYELSPGITHLEDAICKWFSKRIGFSDKSGGIAASGGTLSNLNALVAARHFAGLSSDPNAAFIVSEDAHTSFLKCARIIGLCSNNVIFVKTDNKGCMDLENLKRNIEKCRKQNKKIFSVVATLGTTVRGSIDPIVSISKLCKENNLWLHIDGSIGGIFAISGIKIKGLDNINCANSITINPQKILGITKTSSILLISNLEILKDTFSTGLPYISSRKNIYDRGELGIQGSRPAEIIKLWLGLRFLGMNGINNILKSSINRKVFFEKNLNMDKFEVYTGPLHIISFLPRGITSMESNTWTENTKSELLKLNFMLSRPKYKNKYYLRAVFGNYNTKNSHIKDLLKNLNTK